MVEPSASSTGSAAAAHASVDAVTRLLTSDAAMVNTWASQIVMYWFEWATVTN